MCFIDFCFAFNDCHHVIEPYTCNKTMIQQVALNVPADQTRNRGQYLNDPSVAGSIPRSIGKEIVIADIF